LIGWFVDHDYRCYWHLPFMFNPANFKKERRNVFGHIISQNMMCMPGEKRIEVKGLDEVNDLRLSPQMYKREKKRFMREVERQPQDLTARLLCAHYANLMQQNDEADRLMAENLAIDPKHAPTLAIKGLHDLQRGNYAGGWPGYELRYVMKDKAHFGGGRKFDVPKWNGEPTDEPVLIWTEQGFGDNIMFLRFMQTVLTRAPNAILETQPQLYELFELSHHVPPERLYRKGRTLPPFSYHCSLPSLPATLKLYSERDFRAKPYLQTDPAMVQAWRLRLALNPCPRIGICYRGSQRSERPWSRDIDMELMRPIMDKYGPVVDLTQQGQFESFADSAACIAALDLVLTVDTSVAHLAGALGVPTFLLLSRDPDFRWGLKSDRSPWYDSMRIFRQRKLMDWSDVLEQVEAEIGKMV
jgi:hypothetical protein